MYSDGDVRLTRSGHEHVTEEHRRVTLLFVRIRLSWSDKLTTRRLKAARQSSSTNQRLVELQYHIDESILTCLY